eukprot:jgi/Chlat1/5713/Chrsp38S09024
MVDGKNARKAADLKWDWAKHAVKHMQNADTAPPAAKGKRERSSADALPGTPPVKRISKSKSPLAKTRTLMKKKGRHSRVAKKSLPRKPAELPPN